MIYRSLFSRDVLSELNRLQREMQHAFDSNPSIRGFGHGDFPALNIGGTPKSVEIYAFVPGVDPTRLEASYDRGVLTIAGERGSELPPEEAKAVVHINERGAGRFRRVVSLPDDVDPNGLTAKYRDGVLHISVKRRESALPRRIEIQ